MVFWKFAHDAAETDDGEKGTRNGFHLLFTRGYSVFNAAQVDGYTPKVDADAPVVERIAQAESFFSAIGATVRHGGNQAFYAPVTDHIQMPPFAAFRDSIAYYSTLAHEHTHWTATAGRCDRQLDACLVKPVRFSLLMSTLATEWAERHNALSLRELQNAVAASGSKVAGRFADARIRALVAENNAVNQTVAVRMLTRLGVQADVAGNGREAVEMVRMLPYDIVFMDCQMPEMNGYEAAVEIRRREGQERRHTIIALTAEAIAGTREQCLESGMDDFIAKPVSLKDLIAVIEKLVVAKA